VKFVRFNIGPVFLSNFRMHYILDLFTDAWWISYIWHANRVTLYHQWLSRGCCWCTQRVGCKFVCTMYWTPYPAHAPHPHKILDLCSKMANFVHTIIGHLAKYFPNSSTLVSDLTPNCQGSCLKLRILNLNVLAMPFKSYIDTLYIIYDITSIFKLDSFALSQTNNSSQIDSLSLE